MATITRALLIVTALSVRGPSYQRQRNSEVLPSPRTVQYDAGVLDVESWVWPERCEVHRDRLVDRVVPLRWGYDSPETRDRAYLLAEADFPHAEEPHSGGCVPGPFTYARVKLCLKCLETKRRWLVEHPWVDETGSPRLTPRCNGRADARR
jgi:hypothetical protein